MLKDKTEKTWVSFFKKKKNPDKPPKLELISQTWNPWNPKPRLNKKYEFPANLILKDEIKKINLKKYPKKSAKKTNKKTRDNLGHFQNY